MSPLSWRSTFWFCVAFALSIMITLILFFPETYRINEKFDLELPTTKTEDDNTSLSSTLEPSTTTPDSGSNQKEQTANADQVVLAPKRRINPIGAFLFLKYPFVFLSALISGIAFGCMFAVETIIPDLYTTHYGFNSWQTGMMTFYLVQLWDYFD